MPLCSVAPKPETDGTEGQANGPEDHHQPSFLQRSLYPITLKFEDVVYKISYSTKSSSPKQKTILNGISGIVHPGELLAMLGPSGSGKTTLLTALGGRLSLSGKVTYNGRPFSGPIRRRTGFVSQDDVLYPHLTVFETLLFTALLRLPQSLSPAHKAHQADRVVAELGLARCRNSIIGGPLLRGISGGERKRVSIGQELLIDPSLLLLDEPTSGLDSTTAHRILATVKGLAAGGRTVITTIHQPSSRLYHMFDKLVLLSEGRPIYYGAAAAALDYFSSVGFSVSVAVNPADFLLDLANGIGPDYEHGTDHNENVQDVTSVRETLISAYDKNISTRLKNELCSSDVTGHTQAKETTIRNDVETQKWCTTWWHQFKILLIRGLRERRFEAFNKLRIYQVISVAILGGLLWWQTPSSHIDDRVSLFSSLTSTNSQHIPIRRA
ncbi:ABC transporter family protein [Striga asiatica]|uniref:ABC transporter family protein n=1 Tax=Striga asiatica TaxID=4170 RepID=A0A5A7RGC2_STRAF|nr:ABC transporter family protein [Striga asiatica]